MPLEYLEFQLIADCVFPCIGVAGFALNILVLLGLSNAAISKATMILIAAQVCNNFVMLFCDTLYSPLAISGLAVNRNVTAHVIPGFFLNYGIHCGEGILLAMAVQRWMAISRLLDGPKLFGHITSSICVAASVTYGTVFGVSVLFPCCVMEMGTEQGDWAFTGPSGASQGLGQFIVDWVFVGSASIMYIFLGIRLVVHGRMKQKLATDGNPSIRASEACQRSEQQEFRHELRLLLQFSLICCGWFLHMCVFILITVEAGNEKFNLLLASLFAKVTRCLLSIFEPFIYLLCMKGLFNNAVTKIFPCIKTLDQNIVGNIVNRRFPQALLRQQRSLNAIVPS